MSLTSASDLPSAIKGAAPLCSSCLRAISGMRERGRDSPVRPLRLPATAPCKAPLALRFAGMPPGAGKDEFAQMYEQTAGKCSFVGEKAAGRGGKSAKTRVASAHRGHLGGAVGRFLGKTISNMSP